MESYYYLGIKFIKTTLRYVWLAHLFVFYFLKIDNKKFISDWFNRLFLKKSWNQTYL